MVLDVPTLPGPTNDEESPVEDTQDELTLDFDSERRDPKGLRMLHISHLLQMILQDAQTRLFFKAQSVIQAEIRYYAPKPDDFAYPNVLIGEPISLKVCEATPIAECIHHFAAARKPASDSEIKEKESVSQLFHLKSLNNQNTWYPTLRKTVWVLSQLHDFVNVSLIVSYIV